MRHAVAGVAQLVYWQGHGLDDSEFSSQQGWDIFPVSKTFRLPLRPSHPPIQWVLFFPQGSSGQSV